VHLPGRPDPDWNALSHPEFRVLSAQRHSRKLPRGALAGNRFRIVLREVSGPRAGVEQLVADIARRGVPNYFGEQRFGMRGDNVEQARAMFAGQRVRREQRSLLLSAARAEIFNAILAERVARDCWDRAIAGDVFQLDGSHSIFGPEPLSDEIEWRLGEGDIHPTGALWGRGELRTVEVAAALETDAARAYPDLATGLEAAGLKQERRALRLRPAAFSAHWLDDHSLALSLELGAGSYATAVLREICRTDSA
jgi:tRNA pseudouridine13 synthase